MKINLKDELLKGSIILILMITIYNVINYVFQMSMANMLGPIDYGVLATLMSIVYIFGIPSEAIQTIISKYTSKLNVKSEDNKIKDLMIRSMKNAFFFSLIIFIIFSIISLFLSELLEIDYLLLFITGIIIFGSFLTPINRGILQGKKEFKELGYTLILESSFKIVIAVITVYFGFKVAGAIGAVLSAGIIAFFFSFLFMSSILKSERKREEFGNIYKYNLVSLISVTSIVLFYSLDIIFARIFFSPEISGQYAFVSLIGKTILFVTMGIGKAMFPLTTERHEKKENTRGILKKAVILVGIISGITLLFCLFAPELVIKIISLGSDKYLGASNVLFILALSFTFISFSNIAMLYNISIGKKQNPWIFLIFVIIEIIGFMIFNSNITEFALSLVVSSIILFIYNLILILKK